MKATEFRKLIREEIAAVLKEANPALKAHQLRKMADSWLNDVTSRTNIDVAGKYDSLVDSGILVVDAGRYGDADPVVDLTHSLTKELKQSNPELYKIAVYLNQKVG